MANSPHISVPTLFNFPQIGKPGEGFIAVATAGGNLPFAIARVYWTFGTPRHVQRGGHAHLQTEQVMVAMAGTVLVHTETPGGHKASFTLDHPGTGLYLPKCCWRTMDFQDGAVLLVMASTPFSEADYIRDRSAFERLRSPAP
jgi:hypothetical protein